MTDQSTPLAEVTRRDERTGHAVVESRHRGHVVITVDGEVALALGDAQRATYLRSSVKPIQAMVCLEVLEEHGEGVGQLTSQHLAICWASHRAEDDHLDAVRSLCAVAGIEPEALTCPPDRRPDGPADDRQRIHHNCSGKHALFALVGRHLGEEGPALLARDGQLQQRILRKMEAELGSVTAVGTDGCGAPAVESPLASLAQLFGRIASQDHWAPLRDSGFANPRLIGGTGQLETGLMGTGTVAKLGAEGVFGAGWVHQGRVVGIAIKAEDGATRGAAAVLASAVLAAGRDLGGWPGQRSQGGGQDVGDVSVAPDVAMALSGVFD